jgi:hypothetical protein
MSLVSFFYGVMENVALSRASPATNISPLSSAVLYSCPDPKDHATGVYAQATEILIESQVRRFHIR